MHLKPLIKTTCNTTKKLLVAALCQKKVLTNPPTTTCALYRVPQKNIQEHTKHTSAVQEKPEPTF